MRSPGRNCAGSVTPASSLLPALTSQKLKELAQTLRGYQQVLEAG